MGLFYWNPVYWIFMAPALLFMVYAQWKVKSSYSRWSKIANAHNLSGLQAAEKLIRENGLYGISIEKIPGQLTDNYDPRSKTLNLSEGTIRYGSVASLAIVAHEIGHAQQDSQRSVLLQARSGLVPVVNIGSQAALPLFLLGYFLQFTPLMWLGVIAFSLAFVFTLVTLPVEIDASSRAMKMLRGSGLLMGEKEIRGARSVLTAAALTYVAAMLTALAQLLYYVMLANGGGRRRR